MANTYAILGELIRANTEIAIFQKNRLIELSTKDFPFDDSDKLVSVLKKINEQIILLFETLKNIYLEAQSSESNTSDQENPFEEILDDLIAYANLVWEVNWIIHNIVEQSAREYVAQSTVFLIKNLTKHYEKTSRFLLTPIGEHNFLYRNLRAYIKEITGDEIENADELLKDLGKNFSVFSFPHIYRDNIVGNVVLAHEIGHFVVIVEDLVSQVTPKVQIDITKFNAYLQKMSSTTIQGTKRQTRISEFVDMERLYGQLWETLTKIIESWITELLSDEIAFRLCGPVFVFALAEESLSMMRPHEISENHPPTSYRLQLLLEDISNEQFLDFIDEPQDKDKVYNLLDVVESYIKIPSTGEHEEIYEIAFNAVSSVKDDIRNIASLAVKDMRYKPESFGHDVSKLIKKLEEVIPPCEKDAGEPANIISILNAGIIHKMTWMNQRAKEQLSRSDIEEIEHTINALVLRSIEMSVLHRQMIEHKNKVMETEK